MRLATWNVNSLTARLPRVTDWIEQHQPDVLCMQETKQAGRQVPRGGVRRARLRVRPLRRRALERRGHHQQGRARGGHPGLRHARRRARLPDRVGRVRPAPASSRSTSPTAARSTTSSTPVKLAWLARLRATLDQTCPPGSSVAVCGDFNVAPDDGDVWDPAAFVGATHVSEPEREALRAVEAWGLDDVFRRFNEPGTFTWWDYRAGDFHQGRGMRIDLVLVSDDLAQRATGAFRDRDARKGQKPSDHAPVVVDFADS